ncbi:Hypothetical predicted protein, partial [Pelobates cultripes]
ILALRIQSFLPGLIHRDQVGFVRGREARDNTVKEIRLNTATHSDTTNCQKRLPEAQPLDALFPGLAGLSNEPILGNLKIQPVILQATKRIGVMTLDQKERAIFIKLQSNLHKFLRFRKRGAPDGKRLELHLNERGATKKVTVHTDVHKKRDK